MAPCGIHNPALLEFIRTDVSRELVCKSRLERVSRFGVKLIDTYQTISPTGLRRSLIKLPRLRLLTRLPALLPRKVPTKPSVSRL